MNRRNLLLTTAKTAILAITGARAQTPSECRTVLRVPQARVASPPALDARTAERASAYNGKLCQSYAKTGGPYYSSGLAINMFKDALMFGYHDRKDENGYIQDWKGNPDVKTQIFLRNAFPGRYCLRGKGTGQIALWESFYDGHSLLNWTSVGPGTLHAVTGHDDYEWEVYTVPSSAIQRDFNTFAIRYSQNYPNHVRALVLMHEAHVQAYDQGRRFDPAAIDKLRAGVGYNRMLDNTSNFTFCASKEEWVPEESFTWHAWVNKNKYAGEAVWATPTHLTVASPPTPFQEKWQEHITVYIPAKTIGTRGSLPTLKVSERKVVGNKTKLVLANPSALAAPEYNVGEHLRIDKPSSVAASMNDQCLNHTEGFHIDDRTDTPNRIELLIDFDTSADPPAAITESVWARPVPWLSIGGGRNIPINNIFFPRMVHGIRRSSSIYHLSL